ncbi:MAG: M14 family metallopeptidase [Acidobacteriota bacterium]|nr:M14 family metallopeptidase [Acidobacteriota bacterium]
MRSRVSFSVSMVALAWFVMTGTGFAGERPTHAEVNNFQSTPDYAETFRFIDTLVAESPDLHLETFGHSAAGRPMKVVVVARETSPDPTAAHASGKAIVLIQNGVHAGEIDGKDASLLLLRDIVAGKHDAWLDRLVLLFIPIYNVDGHERISPHNRPNQNGPVKGMGFRTTTDGHDLNRDHLKLDTPEAQAVVALFNRWRPHLHIDNHVTDGVQFDWELTYEWARSPQQSVAVSGWLEQTMPGVLERVTSAGYPVGPYVSLLDSNDPSKGFDSSVQEPRYATGYYPLRNRPSILVENHSYKPYRRRVLVNREFMTALFDTIAEAPDRLVAATTAADRAVVEAGRRTENRPPIAVSYRTAPSEETMVVPFYDWTMEESVALGVPILEYREDARRVLEVPWAHRPEVALSVSRPWGYLVPPGWPEIDRRLRDHGLVVETLAEPAELDVEIVTATGVRRRSDRVVSYQGRVQVTGEIRREAGRVVFPVGTRWIPADQPDFNVAVQLLEPEAPDSLFAWGHLALVHERKEYIDSRVLEPLVREMLKEPAIAAEWAEALEDEAFADNPGARWLWWYRKTPYWDAGVDRLPIYRRMMPLDVETGSAFD